MKKTLLSLAHLVGQKMIKLQPDTFGPNWIKTHIGKENYRSITYRLPDAKERKGKDWEPFLIVLEQEYDGIRERWNYVIQDELSYEDCVRNVTKKTRRYLLKNLSSKKLARLCPYEYGRLRRVHLKRKNKIGANWKKLWRDIAIARAA